MSKGHQGTRTDLSEPKSVWEHHNITAGEKNYRQQDSLIQLGHDVKDAVIKCDNCSI